jgi:hypothetical protein
MTFEFTRAVHLPDADGSQVTTGITHDGDICLLIMDGTSTARLTPKLADQLAGILRDCAERARAAGGTR